MRKSSGTGLSSKKGNAVRAIRREQCFVCEEWIEVGDTFERNKVVVGMNEVNKTFYRLLSRVPMCQSCCAGDENEDKGKIRAVRDAHPVSGRE